MDEQYQQDICRVCRSEGSAERPLYHPCICTGSIKFVHQECLTQWLRYSRKEYCELCSHRFSFTPIYSADMPSRLPVADVLSGLMASLATAGRFWLHYTLVVFAWLCVVPLLACRIYRCLFADSVTSVFPLLKDLISTENIVGDCLQGCLVVTCTVSTLLCLVWMREQILLGGGPEWLEPLPRAPARPAAPPVQPAAAARMEERAVGGEERAEGGEERTGAAADSPAAAVTADNATAAAAAVSAAVTAAVATTTTTIATSTAAADAVISAAASTGASAFTNTTAGVTTSVASAAAATATTTTTAAAAAATATTTTTAAAAAVAVVAAAATAATPDATTPTAAAATPEVTPTPPTTSAAAAAEVIPTPPTAAATPEVTPPTTSAAATPGVTATPPTTSAAAAAEVTATPHTTPAAAAAAADVDIVERADNNTLPAAAADAGGDGEGAPPPAPLPEPVEAAPEPDENNWNPMDWDRGAEEVIWERLLGLDGSLIFLEHVLWVVSLNTLFILVFAFCPYHIGHYCVVAVRLHESVLSSHFEGLITTLVGYCVVGMALVLLHMAASRLTLVRAQRLLGVCYVVVKVSMLAVVEIGLFPLICGWWLDICSLQLLGTTLQERQLSFQKAPGTCLFAHWLVGTVYVFYFASFVLLLREVLRPGALWFVLNLNDPDFNPIQDMIHLSVLSHTRRFLVSVLIFGSTVLVMLWLPVRLILRLAPGFLPYNISAFSDNPSIEPSFQILLLQVFMPALLEHGQAKACLKSVIKCWCVLASKITGLHSYLLGDSPANDEGRDDAAPAPPAGGADQARLPPPPLPFEPYERRNYMSVRLAVLLLLAALSLCLASSALLSVPVWLGRVLITHWLNMLPVGGELPAAAATAAATSPATATTTATATSSLLPSKSTIAWLVIDKESSEPHEIYTAACGLWVCWQLVCHVRLVCDCARLAWTELWRRVAQWALLTARLALVSVTMFVLVPLLYGRLIDLIIMPLRVPLNQTPILFPLQNWALGLLYIKITFGLALMGPNWWLTNALDHFMVGGVRNLHMPTLILDLVLPLVSVLGLALCVPYILVQSFVSLFVCESATLWLVQRAVYPAMTVFACLAVAVRYQCRQFRRLYEHIKNDKYLVGRRLVNYNPSLVEPKSVVSET